jgi:hypothetical protein
METMPSDGWRTTPHLLGLAETARIAESHAAPPFGRFGRAAYQAPALAALDPTCPQCAGGFPGNCRRHWYRGVRTRRYLAMAARADSRTQRLRCTQRWVSGCDEKYPGARARRKEGGDPGGGVAGSPAQCTRAHRGRRKQGRLAGAHRRRQAPHPLWSWPPKSSLNLRQILHLRTWAAMSPSQCQPSRQQSEKR